MGDMGWGKRSISQPVELNLSHALQPSAEALLSIYAAWQEEPQETDEFRDVSAKVDRREALLSLKKAADIINATTQV